MKTHFAYIRVSTVKQGEQGSSLQEQRNAIEAYARRQELRIGAWFEETETAASQGRKAFNKMLAELERGSASGVIIHKIDRSARNLRDWARLGELMDRGVDVRFVHDNLDLSTRGGRLSADIQAVVAADFVRNLREEVKKGRYGRLKQGFYPLPAPLGYQNCGSAKRKEIDPVKGPLVQAAFETYGTGNYSIQSLATEMAVRGLTTGAGAPLPVSHIGRILHNPFYMGLMRLRTTGEVFQGNHAPLVSPGLFNRVQAILSGRLYPRTQIHQFRFRRFMRCAGCGRSLTGERQKGHVYYRCHSFACRGTSVSQKSTEETVLNALQQLCLDERDVRDFRDLLEEQSTSDRDRTLTRAATAKRDLGLVEERLQRLTDALLDGMIDKEMYEARKEALLARRLELRDALQNAPALTSSTALAERFELAFAAFQTYEIGNELEKRDLLRSLGSNLLVRGKNVEFPMHSPFSELRAWATQNGRWPLRGAVRTSRRKSLRALLQSLLPKAEFNWGDATH
jgi:DNA invertase Pin-like site-specific DNA recombinase